MMTSEDLNLNRLDLDLSMKSIRYFPFTFMTDETVLPRLNPVDIRIDATLLQYTQKIRTRHYQLLRSRQLAIPLSN